MAYQGLAYDVSQVMPQALATGLFVSLCTMKRPDGILIGAGQPSGDYENVTGLVDIPCMAPPLADTRLSVAEAKTISEIQTFSSLHILLGGYYPTIGAGVTAGWIAVIDGVAYDLLGAENDSQAQMTRLEVRLSGI